MATARGKQRLLPSGAQDSPSLDVRLLASAGRDLLEESDDSGFMDLTSKDLDRLNLVDTPPGKRGERKGEASISSPSKSKTIRRPSWGPRTSPNKSNLRLLQGVEETSSSSRPVQIQRKERTLGGLGQTVNGATTRPRQSIFAKPAFLQQNQQQDVEGRPGDDEEGDDSFYKDPALSSSSNSVKSRIAAIEASRLEAENRQSMSASNGTETKEQQDAQLSELKRMNEVFEAYERMLSGSANQIENFTQRIAETNSLLDIYIDLMRQADRTQQLLLDGDWKGATEDESAHALAMELAERERRRKQEEAEQATRLAALQKQEAEQARLEAERAEQRRAAASSTRGARGSAAVGRGASSASARGRGVPVASSSRIPSATRGRAVSASATSTRGSTSTARGASTSSGLNNQYAGVRSSGYGPPR